MTWIPILLTDPSASLRFLVLKNLLNRTDDDKELKELKTLREMDPLITNLEKLQKSDGSFSSIENIQISTKHNLHLTSMVLQRLGYLEFDSTNSIVRKAVEYIFSKQNADGSWPLEINTERDDEEIGYQMIPNQTSIPLLGLAMSGYATDARAEKAYNWLLENRLEDGSWMTGISAGNCGGVAGYRKLPHSQWGCRSNTTAALSCLAYHPKLCKSEATKRALDLVLGTNIKNKSTMGFYLARWLGLEPYFGQITYMAKFDIAHLLRLCWKIGASIHDTRISEFIEFVRSLQGKFGLWESPNYPRITRWLSYDLLYSLSNLETKANWISLEPKTPFQAYPKKNKRF
ncbi:MAG: hypothetical protein BAJALOKI1v1_30045 [Promethearchaeota archaeon]|nr:MAG: hypothetical protein BAJALOKI1v1_30045 [Candidatus Lokiarchaeota archaeon]